MIIESVVNLFNLIKRNRRLIIKIKLALVVLLLIALAGGKMYQNADKDSNRGAAAVENGLFGESYSTPKYLMNITEADKTKAKDGAKGLLAPDAKYVQGWSEADSLWFYTTTQGSDLMPYDFFLKLEQESSTEPFVANQNIDKYRYLPQSKTLFNPDALPVGFAKNTYKNKDYVGYTCAACHTGQVTYKGTAIRIDGGPAMADMEGFLHALQASLEATLHDAKKFDRFADNVIALKNDYKTKKEVADDLQKWTDNIVLYNTINRPFIGEGTDQEVHYGYGRLDAFGRIYNRVLEHVINKEQLKVALMSATDEQEQRIFSDEKIVDKLLSNIEGEQVTIIGDTKFVEIIDNLKKLPNVNEKNLAIILKYIFNSPSAPVSYPFLWDVPYSDYVQWNGLAANAGLGPLGRNTGEVIGVFATLDWKENNSFWSKLSLSTLLTGQSSKNNQIDFSSSINKVNLSRLESHLRSLQSPQWPTDILGDIKYDADKKGINAERGELVYNEYCSSCHQVIKREDPDRQVIAFMSDIKNIGTDPVMATNSVSYKGYAGNFESVYQKTAVGSLVIQKHAPVVQVLTAVTTGAVAIPDHDRPLYRRGLDWLYMVGKSLFENDVKDSIKMGNYTPDTTANPYRSLLSYKARSLNGIWATAPFLHNGSVPDLYSLLLPKKRVGDPDDGKYRPDKFVLGSREIDPVKVGIKSEGYDGFIFDTSITGNDNGGHEYGARLVKGPDGKDLPVLTEQERWDLIEYIKTL